MKKLFLLVNLLFCLSCEKDDQAVFDTCFDLSSTAIIADSSAIADVQIEEKTQGGLVIYIYENGLLQEPIKGEFCGEIRKDDYFILFNCCSDSIQILDL